MSTPHNARSRSPGPILAAQPDVLERLVSLIVSVIVFLRLPSPFSSRQLSKLALTLRFLKSFHELGDFRGPHPQGGPSILVSVISHIGFYNKSTKIVNRREDWLAVHGDVTSRRFEEQAVWNDHEAWSGTMNATSRSVIARNVTVTGCVNFWSRTRSPTVVTGTYRPLHQYSA